MPLRQTNVKNSVHSGFLAIIERYWLVLLGLIVATPILLRYMNDANSQAKVNDAKNENRLNEVANMSPITQLSAMNKITTNSAYHVWAQKIAADLGTLYSARAKWYSFFDFFRSITENDTALYNDLKDVTNPGQKRILTDLYFVLTSKNLTEDVITYLDTEYLKKLPLFN